MCVFSSPSLVCVSELTVYQLLPSPPECPAVFPGTNYSGTCPFFSSVLEVMWPALQGRHHHYTHISSAEILLPVPTAPPPQSWRNDNYDIRPLKRQEIVQLSCPLFQCFFFFLTDSIFCGLALPTISVALQYICRISLSENSVC